MSDNDLIRRGDTLKELEHTLFYDERDQRTAVECVKSKPAVLHEMTARVFVREKLRLDAWCVQGHCNECKHKELCSRIGESRTTDFAKAADAYVELIEQWAKEHSERKRKTYAEDFFEKYPKCSKYPSGHPLGVCRKIVYGQDIEAICKGECYDCWNEQMEDEDE